MAAGAVVAAGKSHGNSLDQPIDSYLRGQLAADHAALQQIMNIGPLVAYVLAAAAVAVAIACRRGLSAIALAVICVPVAYVVTEAVLKPLVNERIANFLTYPSGHTEAVFCLAAVIAVLQLNAPSARMPRLPGILLFVLTIAIGCAVAVAVIALNFHYFTDTVAGAAVACAVALLTAFGLDTPRVRRWLTWPSRRVPESDLITFSRSDPSSR